MDDWKNLKRVLPWLKENIDDERIFGAKILTDVYTWIDAYCAVHSYMIGHTGGAISMEHGVLHDKFPVQRLNIKRSMEVELVGLSKYIP